MALSTACWHCSLSVTRNTPKPNIGIYSLLLNIEYFILEYFHCDEWMYKSVRRADKLMASVTVETNAGPCNMQADNKCQVEGVSWEEGHQDVGYL